MSKVKKTKLKSGSQPARPTTEDRIKLQQLLIELADEKTLERFSDRNLDRENEKIHLLSGAEITIREIKEQQALIEKELQPYKPKFRVEFYKEINRLNGWVKSDNELHHKPMIVARFTNEVIYGRFPKFVLPALQLKNPFVAGHIRLNKHHQWLTNEGKIMLEEFLEEAIKEMKLHAGWHEFWISYASKYGLAYQKDLFTDVQH